MRTRMTSAMRRASTGLSFSTKMPTLSRSSSKNSLKVDPAQAPTTSDTHLAPSPVVETAEESPSIPAQLGPSPLSNSAPTPEVPSTQVPPPVEPVAEPAASVAEPSVEAAAEAPPAEESQPEQLTRSPDQFHTELSSPPSTTVPEPQPFGFTAPILPAVQQPAVVDSPIAAPTDAGTAEDVPEVSLAESSTTAPLAPAVDSAVQVAVEERRNTFGTGHPTSSYPARRAFALPRYLRIPCAYSQRRIYVCME
ncbi:hypothetical protein C8Q79DRAFT_411063 [Trametes meyenii]|nr:hypothetical protein C8Q79DRAFT_411063 [Trametes meyenii]